MYLITILFVIGVCGLFWLSTLPVTAAALLLPAALAALRWPGLRPPALLALGFAWAVLHAALAQSPVLDRSVEGRTVLVEGTVAGLPDRRSGPLQRFIFHAERLDDGSGWNDFDGKIRLGWYGDGGDPDAGERWQLAVRLKRPYGMANPGAFDYERWLFQQRIHATGYVREDPRNRRLSKGRVSPIAGYRNRLLRAFAVEGGTPGRAFVQALTVGERGAIGSAQWQVLNATGTSHLMAISGLHISLVAGLGFWLVRRGWPHFGPVTGFLPAPRAAAIAAITVAVLYAMLAGFGIPARRALVIVCVLMLAILSDRYSSFAQVVCLAALCTLLLDPLSVLSAGWWLSFQAVIIIAWLATGRHGTPGRGRRMLMHVALAFCIVPVLLLFFQQASLLAPIANVFAVPFVGLLIVPLALLGCVLFAVNETLGMRLLGLGRGFAGTGLAPAGMAGRHRYGCLDPASTTGVDVAARAGRTGAAVHATRHARPLGRWCDVAADVAGSPDSPAAGRGLDYLAGCRAGTVSRGPDGTAYPRLRYRSTLQPGFRHRSGGGDPVPAPAGHRPARYPGDQVTATTIVSAARIRCWPPFRLMPSTAAYRTSCRAECAAVPTRATLAMGWRLIHAAASGAGWRTERR